MLKQGDIARIGSGNLRHGLVAGEALPPAVLAEWKAATGLELYEAFGMSECSTFVSNRPGLAIRPGSPGKPQAGRRSQHSPSTTARSRCLPAAGLAVHRPTPA
jgi:acyl-coenzyme A synthetase/AMP-(fatty) acid ligase